MNTPKNKHFEPSVDYHGLAVPGRWQLTGIHMLIWHCSWPFAIADEEEIILCKN